MLDIQEFSPADAALLRLGRELKQAGYMFTTVTPLTQARVNARPGHAWAEDLAGVFGWSRPFKPDLVSKSILDAMRQAGVLAPVEGGWRSLVRLSSLGSQVFFHSAFPTLAADAVFFGPDTVRFVGAIRSALAGLARPPRRAFDLGCGAGPGGIAVADAVPGADVLMGDINEGALRLARINAALNEVPRVQVLRSDLLAGTEGEFDLIVSNPPYMMDAGERAYRHGGGALGEGLSVRILDASLARLAPGGTLVLYTGSAVVRGVDGFRAAAEARLAGTCHHWSYAELDPDVFGEELETGAYAGADRIAAVVLTVSAR